MTDSKYFSTTKKGEVAEFKEDLRASERSKKKDAVKKVIAAMTVGKDVSMLFPDVVNCMQTDDLELKKLVYLYLINYAKTQPDLAIMAVNTFVKDSQDPNPLIRALAVRTMGCIRVDKITEYLCDPLQRCLKDDDPYVRKTAAVCVAKLYDIAPELVEDRGFLDTLRDMLSDANPMVVANAVAALSEIQEISGKPMLHITSQSLFKLLRALNECTEWGQVFILDSLANFDTRDPKDAESIVERVTPRLQHANCAVVLSAVKVILRQLPLIADQEQVKAMHKKMAPPLVTLLSAEPEIQFVALRNIELIVQRVPELLSHEVKVFFCKYNDPIYVKMEKLEIMIKLANESNIDQVLLEFKEYATEVDVDFVRKSVRAIGRCAVNLENAAERCINVLLDLIQTKVNYVVQEAVVVIKDIFRRYPNKYESIISTLCESLDTLDEPEAKASMVWIIGEYAERIDNADELLEQFLETFPEETSQVQLQLVTATVKLFLKKPTERPQQLIQLVLTYATQETDNPDLRDRAYIYWRLLSTTPEVAKDVVLSEKPVISSANDDLEPALLDDLIRYIGTLSSVYHKRPEQFVTRQRLAVTRADELETNHQFEDEGQVYAEEGGEGKAPVVAAPEVDLLGDLLDLGEPVAPVGVSPTQGGGQGNVLDLLGDLSVGAPPAAPIAGAAALGGVVGASAAASPRSPVGAGVAGLSVICNAEQGKGLVIGARVTRQAAQPQYAMSFTNTTGQPLDGFMIQLNKNTFGLAPVNQNIPLQGPIPAGATVNTLVPLVQNPNMGSGAVSPVLQVAIRCNQLGVLYMSDNVSLAGVLLEDGRIEAGAFVDGWKVIPETLEIQQSLTSTVTSADAAKTKLEAAQLFVMAHKQVPGTSEEVLYVTGRVGALPTPVQLLMELRYVSNVPGVRCFFKSDRADLAPLLWPTLQEVLA